MKSKNFWTALIVIFSCLAVTFATLIVTTAVIDITAGHIVRGIIEIVIYAICLIISLVCLVYAIAFSAKQPIVYDNEELKGQIGKESLKEDNKKNSPEVKHDTK